MPNAPKRAFKGVFIPREIWDSPELTWMHKCLLAEIDSLDDGSGCYASNAFLAQRFDSTPRSIAVTLSKLREKGWIKDISVSKNGRMKRLLKVSWRDHLLLIPVNGKDAYRQQPLTVGLTPVNSKTDPSIYKRENRENNNSRASSTGKSKPHPDHVQFLDIWCEAFQAQYGQPYKHGGGKDGVAINSLLAHRSIPEIMAMATGAWANPTKFNCKHAISISGLNARWNEIMLELRTAGDLTQPQEEMVTGGRMSLWEE